MEEDRRGGGGRVGGEVAATVHLTVRTLVQMPHVVLRTTQQGPSVAFFLRARGTAHGARCTVHRACTAQPSGGQGFGAGRTAHVLPSTSTQLCWED